MQPQLRSRPSHREEPERERYQLPHRGIPFLSSPRNFSDIVPSRRPLNYVLRHPHRPLHIHSPFHLLSPSRTVCCGCRLKCRRVSDILDALILLLVGYLGLSVPKPMPVSLA